MSKKRTFPALALCAALTLTPALAAGEDKFPAVSEYPGYADVAETDWFYANARLCYEVGLMTGTDKGFEPKAILTVGSVAAIAARMNEALTGEPIPMATPAVGQTLPWYASYVDYLTQRGVAVGDPEQNATRQEFVAMLSAILPEDALAPINAIRRLPDTADADVLAFYNAGILTGIDGYGTFAGDRTLMRSECAGMVSRIARSELRKDFAPLDYTPFTAAYMTPDTVLFQNGATAGQYLPKVMARIAALERRDEALGVEFNWFHTDDAGVTYLNSVKDGALSDLGVIKDDGTEAYRNFDVQVFYSRYIGLTGETL